MVINCKQNSISHPTLNTTLTQVCTCTIKGDGDNYYNKRDTKGWL